MNNTLISLAQAQPCFTNDVISISVTLSWSGFLPIPFVLCSVDSEAVFDSAGILKTIDFVPSEPFGGRRFGRLQILSNSKSFSSLCNGISTEGTKVKNTIEQLSRSVRKWISVYVKFIALRIWQVLNDQSNSLIINVLQQLSNILTKLRSFLIISDLRSGLACSR